MVADRLLSSDNPRAQAAIGRLLESWSIADPDAALVWLIARGPAVDARYFAALAAGYAQGDIRLTAETTDRLPPAARGEWITEVAAAYAQRDPDAALEWLARYRTSPEYDTWISAAAQRALRNMPMSSDPAAAIRLLTTTTKPEPAAVTAVVSSWLQVDAPAATDWALRLPAGEARNSALAAIVSREISNGSIDSRILPAFSDAASREAALTRAVSALRDLANRNPAQARAIANAHYTTPELWQRAQAIFGAAPR
jgi:hypothetical protein